VTEPSTTLAPAYRALALQVTTRAINGMARHHARPAIALSIDRLGRQIVAAVGWLGGDTRLVVLPEYVLTGFPMDEPIPAWADRAAFDPSGPEYEAFGAITSRPRHDRNDPRRGHGDQGGNATACPARG
jgi:hypothetical protein